MSEIGEHPGESLDERIQRSLCRCLEWSQQGRHRKVLTEVERSLSRAKGHPRLESQLLIWKAQALLSMDFPERALGAASDSWNLVSSPHACHLMSVALAAIGEHDRADDFLAVGSELFPDAIHLPIQRVMLLAEQGRLPEALDILDGVDVTSDLPDDLHVFFADLRANLLATVGRWIEAEVVLEEGLGRYPNSVLLLETHESIRRQWNRRRAERRLAESWRRSMESVDGVSAEVDDAIKGCGTVLGLSSLAVLAARRLWRAFHARHPIRVQSPEPWAAAIVTAVLELDGNRPNAVRVARAVSANPSTARSALARVRRYLKDLDPGFARRSFAVDCNPRLDDPPGGTGSRSATLLRFPG